VRIRLLVRGLERNGERQEQKVSRQRQICRFEGTRQRVYGGVLVRPQGDRQRQDSLALCGQKPLEPVQVVVAHSLRRLRGVASTKVEDFLSAQGARER